MIRIWNLHQNLLVAVFTVLFLMLFTVLRKKRAHYGKRFCLCKMFKIRFSRSWKCLKTWNSPEQPVEVSNSKNKETTETEKRHHIHDILVCHCFWSSLWSTNNSNMTGRSVENHCLVVLNVKLLVKRRFKTFYRLLNLLYTAFALNTTINKACFAQTFCMS